ncbi:MAG: ferritin family protein [Sphingomonadaceae bacterium]
MTWQEILNAAMHLEPASMRLYTDLARRANDSGTQRLFESLPAEEATHKLFFERAWDEEITIEN